MSSDNMQAVINRMLDDNDFRDQLMSDPDTTLQAYDLDANERELLMDGDMAQLEQYAGPLDERVSKSGMLPIRIGQSKGGIGTDGFPGGGGGSGT